MVVRKKLIKRFLNYRFIKQYDDCWFCNEILFYFFSWFYETLIPCFHLRVSGSAYTNGTVSLKVNMLVVMPKSTKRSFRYY